MWFLHIFVSLALRVLQGGKSIAYLRAHAVTCRIIPATPLLGRRFSSLSFFSAVGIFLSDRLSLSEGKGRQSYSLPYILAAG